MKINIPGRDELNIKNLLVDYNGTIALDGKVIETVKSKIVKLSEKGIKIFVLTADTHGTVMDECSGLPVEVRVFNNEKARFAKEKIAVELCGENCVAIGNGFNDGLMFIKCSLGIIVVGEEGCSIEAMKNADIMCRTIEDAFDLIINEKRLIATLRG